MKHLLFSVFALLLACALHAAPGAHGPNGEHLDAAVSAASSSDVTPKFEAFTENFELVGRLYDTHLLVLVDVYKTNLPVLNASVELEVNGLKAQATFHEDAGDYAFNDVQILAAIKKPGEHELVFTLSTETESDLILATWVVGTEIDDHEHEHGEHDHHHDSQLGEWLHSPLFWALIVGVFISVLVLISRFRLSRKN